MMQEQEENFTVIEQGRQAQVAISYSEGVIREIRETALTRAIGEFRGGTMTAEKLWGLIGSLDALEHFRSALRADAQQGIRAQEREMTSGR